MEEKELMAEAKRRYPEGCKIRCANDNSHNPEDAIVKHSRFNYMRDPRGIHHGNAWVVLRGKWATIIDNAEPFTIGGYVRTIVDGDPDKDKSHNTFKKGEIYQIKSIDSDGLINFDQPGPRLYSRPNNCGSYPKECEWIGMNPHETLPQEESLVEVINNFPIY